jgi:hypothetical protein
MPPTSFIRAINPPAVRAVYPTYLRAARTVVARGRCALPRGLHDTIIAASAASPPATGGNAVIWADGTIG